MTLATRMSHRMALWIVSASAALFLLLLAAALPSAARADAPELAAVSPPANAHGVPLDTTVVLTYSQPIRATTVTSHTVAAYAMMQGLVTATHGVAGEVVTVSPARAFLAGELVYTTATTMTTDLAATHPLSPTVWAFRIAAPGGHGRFRTYPDHLGDASSWGRGAAWADIDHDGDLDLFVGRGGSESAVYRNDGAGAFVPVLNVGADIIDATAWAWGDMDGDGDLDLAVGDFDSDRNVLYANNGGHQGGTLGTFGAFQPFASAYGTLCMAWGDVDGDGDLDLAVGRTGHQNVLYANDGAGGLTPLANFGTGSDYTMGVAWGDMDGDGDLDLALANAGDQQNVIYPNDGGTLGAPRLWGSGSDSTYDAAWADHDGDGDLDLAAANSYSFDAIYPNLGDGSFGPPITLGDPMDDGKCLGWADFDGDGDLDLAVGSMGDPNVVHLNNGGDQGGVLGTYGVAVPFGTGIDQTHGLAWGDADGDGDMDLVTADFGGYDGIYWNDPERPQLTEHVPGRDVVGVALDDSLVFTYSLPIGATSITSHTVSVHTMQQGTVWGTAGVWEGTVTLKPSRPLLPGERVWVSASDDVADITGTHPLTPTVWGFDAGTGDGGTLPNDTLVFGTGSDTTTSLAWGDMDGDGDLDLAVGNSGGDQSTVYRNDGGTLVAAAPFGGANTSPYALAWGDYDRDGDLDLAVGNAGEQDVVLPNEGGFTFGVAIPVGSATASTTSLAWGDMDGDGDLDLAAGTTNEGILVYANQGDGTFGAGALVGPAAEVAACVAWGDLDGDGDLDLAVGDSEGNDAVYPNLGDGTFDAALFLAEHATLSLAWGDFDGDGDLDLARGNAGRNTIHLSDPATGLSQVETFGPDEGLTYSLVALDFDGDGDLDLAAGNRHAPNAVYLNDGAGALNEAIPLGSAEGWCMGLAWGDLEGDGDVDLAVGDVGGRNVIYLNAPRPRVLALSPRRNAHDVALDAAVVLTYTQPLSATAVTSRTVAVHGMMQGLLTGAHALDEDVVTVTPARPLFAGEPVFAVGSTGIANISGTHPASGEIWQFTGAPLIGYGRFYETPLAFGDDGDSNRGVAWGDFDGDGDLDLAAARGRQQTVVYPNVGDGTWGEPIPVGSAGENVTCLAWGDMDGDGDLDLAAGISYAPNAVYPNLGDGTFGDRVLLSAVGDATTALAWGDADGDGDLDLAVVNWSEANHVHLNDGAGGFGQAITVGHGYDTSYGVAWGDMDGDGDLDLAIGDWTGQDTIYCNDGSAGFDEGVDVGSSGSNTYGVAWGDLDGDGDLDLATTEVGGQNEVYLNAGDGTFPQTAPFGTGHDQTYSVAWADWDADGDLDLALGNGWRTPSTVCPNNGDGTLGEPIVVGAAATTWGLAWGDVDGDGDLDLAMAEDGAPGAVHLNERPPMHEAFVDGAEGADDAAHGEGEGANAFATLRYALRLMAPGGTLHVATGTYSEWITLTRPITLLGTCLPVLDGGGGAVADNTPVVRVETDEATIHGFEIGHADIGVWSVRSSDVRLAFNHFVDCDMAGLYVQTLGNPPSDEFVRADHNWWGHAQGPDAGSGAMGPAYTEPWLNAPLSCSTHDVVGPAEGVVDQVQTVGLWVDASSTCTHTLTLARYEEAPRPVFVGAGDAFYDLRLDDPSCVTSLVARFYYTAADVAALLPGSFEMRWWDPLWEAWMPCSDQTLVSGAIDGYAGYVEARFDETTSPSLAALCGTEFLMAGVAWRSPDDVTVVMDGGSGMFCPGWTAHYSQRVTNTSGAGLSGVVVTAALPEDWTMGYRDGGSTVPGVYDEGAHAMVWDLGDLAADASAIAWVRMHSLSTTPPGTVLTVTFTTSATEYTSSGIASLALVADEAACWATPTATPEPTLPPAPTATATASPSLTPTPMVSPTPTYTPSGWRLHMPLIMR